MLRTNIVSHLAGQKLGTERAKTRNKHEQHIETYTDFQQAYKNLNGKLYWHLTAWRSGTQPVCCETVKRVFFRNYKGKENNKLL
jgi:hypothetical protein